MAFTIAATRKNNNSTTAGAAASQEKSEFDGLWINVGVVTEQTDEEGNTNEKFNRITRGIAVSDLVDHKVYASTNPDWAAEANLVNQIHAAIREASLELEEGEARPVNLSVQVYRRQEQVEQVAPAAAQEDIKSQLFG